MYCQRFAARGLSRVSRRIRDGMLHLKPFEGERERMMREFGKYYPGKPVRLFPMSYISPYCKLDMLS